MFRMVRRLSQNALSAIQRRYVEATIDEELKMEEERTVAFKFSSALFTKFYQGYMWYVVCYSLLRAIGEELYRGCALSVSFEV